MQLNHLNCARAILSFLCCALAHSVVPTRPLLGVMLGAGYLALLPMAAASRPSPVEKDARRWHPLCQLEEKIDQVVRSIDQQVDEVFHLVEGGCCVPGGCTPSLPAVARATAGRLVRCEWLVK